MSRNAMRGSMLGLALLTLTACGGSGPSHTALAASAASASATPSHPSGLVVEYVGDDALLAKWSAPVDQGAAPVTGYRVFPGTREPIVLPVARTEYLMAGLGRGELRLIQVAAVSDAGQGEAAVAVAPQRNRIPRAAPRAERASAPVPPASGSAAASASTGAAAASPATVRPAGPAATGPSAQAVASVGDSSGWPALWARVAPSVVRLTAHDCSGQERGSGSAFFISDDLLATAGHVVERGDRLTARIGEQVVDGTAVGHSYAADLALVRLRQAFPSRALPLATALPPVGTPIVSIGFPWSLGQSLQHGVVSAVNVAFEDPQRGLRGGMLQSDIQTGQGGSGGPVLTADGKVVGLISVGPNDGVSLNGKTISGNVELSVGAPTAQHLLVGWTQNPQEIRRC